MPTDNPYRGTGFNKPRGEMISKKNKWYPKSVRDPKKCPLAVELECKDCRLSEKIVTDPETRDTVYACHILSISKELYFLRQEFRKSNTAWDKHFSAKVKP